MQPLDRDPPHGRATWRLVVTASDGELQADTEVVVNLKDINDNAPVFLTARVEATVIENSPNGTPVVTITAEDFDDKNEGSNSKLIYSLQKNAVDEETGLAIFTVNASTGSISTAMCCLDRERASHYSLTVAATDGGGLQGSCEVLVLVADENDVPPRWGRAEWTVEVTEGAPLDQVLATLTVKDPDTRNSLAYRVAPYSGRGWQMVKIERRTAGDGAELRSLVPLDYENPDLKDGLRFQVQVTDQGTDAWENKYRVGEATVIVRILDVNDNAPSFENVQQSVRISEDAPLGTVVAKVPAFDLDQNRNGLIRYNLAGRRGSSPHFGIDHTGTIRTIGLVDREAISKHSLVVHATDHGVPPRQSSATVTTKPCVAVTQLMSGQSVQFSQKNYVVQVSEAAAPGTILLLQAVSPDEDAAVLYKLASDSAFPLFRVDAQSGALELLGPLDFEYQTQHNLTVIATSKDGKIGSNEAHVTVEVLDANDHSPVFAV
ncbi:putative neural-cadherin 2, partial [Hyalella azteca]|uniref:Neural-cadherin 2 n=1 Tax=Hyalella azteca TaxID=294128 RepID=A0A979FF93_HYAAZ